MQNSNIIVDDKLIKYTERQKGDVVTTKAQNSIITPQVNFNTGYKLFIDWYLNYKSK